LRARGQLVEVRAAELRFTPNEAAAFLTDVMGLPLSAADVAALEARTEGWIAGLQLAALAMRNHSDLAGFIGAFTGSNRFVVDYLAGDVFARQPPHLQAFLLQTSVLDRLCGPLCDAVLGITPDAGRTSNGEHLAIMYAHPAPDSYSQLILEQVERANLFLVALDDERRWYRYHHLFGDVLRARLQSGATPEDVATLHRRASAWYEQTGEISPAVQHALAAHDWPHVATLIERHAEAFTMRGEALVVQRWMHQLPGELVRSRPALAVQVGWMYLFTGQLDDAERLLSDLDVLATPQLPTAVAGSALLLRSTIARGRGDDAATLALAQQALDVLPVDAPAAQAGAKINIGIVLLRQGKLAQGIEALQETTRLGLAGGDLYVALAAVDELAALYIRQGALRMALQSCEQALAAVERQSERPIPASGLPLERIGEVLYEWNELPRAAAAFDAAVERLRGATELAALLRAYLGLARTQAAQGRRDAMAATVAQCQAWFAQLGHADHPTLTTHIASFWARVGASEEEEHRVQPATAEEQSDLGRMQRVTRVRQHLRSFRHDDEPNAAAFVGTIERLIAPLLAEAVERGWVADQIELLLLLALAFHAAEQPQQAQEALDSALTLAAPAGYVRAFVDEGAPLAPLLREAAARGIAPRYVAQILVAFPDSQVTGTHQRAKPTTLVEPLSARELEVLRLLGTGRSNQEIAHALVIAVGTVKRHISSILGKLGARSRLEAVAYARALSLLGT
ncbi:MAG: hypothetical protein H7Y32_03300, partial [Chloroflexales bacterium]|nr:hypothetical protein [Chloroflexales bacterium]